VEAMDASGPWTPIGVALAMTEPTAGRARIFCRAAGHHQPSAQRRAAGRCRLHLSHGAGLTTEEDDPDGSVERVREIVGPACRSRQPWTCMLMFQSACRVDRCLHRLPTNPHLDMRERRREAAAAIREMLGGVKPQRAFIRLPIVPPT